MILRSLVIFLLLASLFSCSKKDQSGRKTKQEPVAKVYDKYLYPSDLENIIPKQLSPADSAMKAKNYIDVWIKKQLTLHRAEQVLTSQQKDVEDQLEDYRASLLIYRYKQEVIKQKLDTLVKDAEIEAFYKSHEAEFKLTSNVVKCLFAKIPQDAPNVNKFLSDVDSKNSKDQEAAKEYLHKMAKEFSTFKDEWVYFNEISNQIEGFKVNGEDFLRSKKHLLEKTPKIIYFAKIYEYRLKGEPIPMSLIKNNIKTIVLNKRRLELISQLEQTIFNEAKEGGKIKTYEKK